MFIVQCPFLLASIRRKDHLQELWQRHDDYLPVLFNVRRKTCYDIAHTLWTKYYLPHARLPGQFPSKALASSQSGDTSHNAAAATTTPASSSTTAHPTVVTPSSSGSLLPTSRRRLHKATAEELKDWIRTYNQQLQSSDARLKVTGNKTLLRDQLHVALNFEDGLSPECSDKEEGDVRNRNCMTSDVNQAHNASSYFTGVCVACKRCPT